MLYDMIDVACVTCKDLVRELEWTQLALDGDHEVRFRAVECQCGYRMLDVTVVNC